MTNDKDTQVIINAKIIDSKAHDQIKLMAKSGVFKGLISIMPDVHPGIGSVIGFTGRFKDCVIPNVVGVDIGCGVTSYPIGNVDIDFETLDKYIRAAIPLGFKSHKDTSYLKDINPKLKNEVLNLTTKIVDYFYANTYRDYIDPILQIGTLGGGNHFIEIEVDDENNKYITVHSGSRNLGQKVARWYQGEAHKFHDKLPGTHIPKDLHYLTMDLGGDDYITALYMAQEYASLNRRVMINKILNYFNIQLVDDNIVESTHNFISPKDNIVRKGAISAHENEQVIIPLNMRDGIIIGQGKGNSKYNYSAPHGAGRLFGRNVMKKQLRDGIVTLDNFKSEMNDIFSTSVCGGTIDESPFAYKSFDDIKEYLEETVDIKNIMKPIYNLKAN